MTISDYTRTACAGPERGKINAQDEEARREQWREEHAETLEFIASLGESTRKAKRTGVRIVRSARARP